VFSPEASQEDVYDYVAKPLIADALCGINSWYVMKHFNCVFLL
jgi:hypothetical protein